MNRIQNTSKNLLFSTVSTVLMSIMNFITRTVFIHTIGISYLGANSLFTNVLSLLSLTELGIGSAISFSLYKPLANHDINTIKSLMKFYKRAYQAIAGVIATLGIMLLPFLRYIINDPGEIQHIHLIYIVFLYNTVVSYLFTYKTTLLIADQKTYMLTRVNMVISVITAIIQLLIMVAFKNYFIYLFSGMIIQTTQWFYINSYINRQYPYLSDKEVLPLEEKEKKTITKNVKAMVFHKIGELCITQTDNIIISSLISIVAVGLYNNYYTIILIINKFASSVLSAATASLGNLIATESVDVKYNVFKKYNFLGFWIYCWTSICLIVLLNPFVEIWLGEEYLLDTLTLSLVIINYYLVGMRTPIGNFKMAAGLYAQDRWAPIIQAIINLVVSVVGALKIGIAGVFLGTVVSSVCVPCWYRPIVVYKYVFKRSAKDYFYHYFIELGVVFSCLACVIAFNKLISTHLLLDGLTMFALKFVSCLIIPNAIMLALFHKKEEFIYLKQLVMKMSKVLR